MLTLDIFLYLLLAIYFDMVIPKEYGQQYHPLFFLYPSFWRGDQATKANDTAAIYLPKNNSSEDAEEISNDFVGKEGIRLLNY